MYVMIYVADGVAYLPTVVFTEAGFALDQEPVSAIPLECRSTLIDAAERAMAVTTATIRTPKPGKASDWVVFKHAKSKAVSAFDKKAKRWLITDDQGTTSIFRFKPALPRGWSFNRENSIEVPNDASIQDMARTFVDTVYLDLNIE